MPRPKGSPNKVKKFTIKHAVAKIKKGESFNGDQYKFYNQHSASILKAVSGKRCSSVQYVLHTLHGASK